jgi:hypothetical protein
MAGAEPPVAQAETMAEAGAPRADRNGGQGKAVAPGTQTETVPG